LLGVAAGPLVLTESRRAPGDFRRKWHGLASDRAARSGHRRMPHRRRDRRAPRRRGTRSEMLGVAPGRDQVVLEALLLMLMQQHPRRPEPVAEHREPIREKRLLHLHEDLTTLAKQRVRSLRLLCTV